ncbi:MAG TPA: cytochrome c oxidase assembly protein [Aeromicrobium sp.]|nr:cytochrome c oxidase assembly protein [Aeromicrobium sp.]
MTARRFGAAFAAAAVALVVALWLGGGAPQPTPLGLPDAGALVGWALPLVSLASRLAAIATIGFLVLATFLVPNRGDEVEGLSVVAVSRASVAAACWSGGSLLLYVLTVADVFGRPLPALSTPLLWTFATDTSLGRALVLQAVAGAAIAVAARSTVAVRWLAVWTMVSILALLPVSLTGHVSATGAHDLATTSLFVHVAAASLWVGSLAALVWLANRGSKRLPAAIQRYSVMAAWAYGALAIAGVANASVRLVHASDLVTTPYGVILLAKTAALLLLGAWAWRVRRHIAAGGGRFAALVVAELVIMAAAIGLAVALGRTPTPANGVTVTPAEDLLGGPIPPPPTLGRLLWGWEPTGVALAVVLFGAAFYLAGLRVLRRRGDRWPGGRTLAWFAGIAVVYWAGIGGLGQYSHVLFSAHMGSHMMLGMVAPILLVLGAPMTLALRTLPGPRQPGDVSPRALLTSFLHSPLMRFLTHPVVGPALFVGSLFALYFTGLFEYLMASHWGHGAMQLHFLAVGALYYYVIIGVDPSPRTLPPAVRFGVLMFTIPFHAFFSVALMSAKTVIAAPYWEVINRPYRTNLLADQYLGGGISWAMGEVPLVLVFGALFVQWIRSDVREARRRDRAADRDGDAELEAYNARLRNLHGKK